MPSTIVIIHLGAGYQSNRNHDQYKKLAISAVKTAQKVLSEGGSAVDAVECAIAFLEDSELTNAGKGSNLDLNGNVSCDASIADTVSCCWGAVGSISSIQNPIKAARCVLNQQITSSPEAIETGLIEPLLLVGKDATDWAIQKGCETSNDLITSRTINIHKKHLAILNKTKSNNTLKRAWDQIEPRFDDVAAFEEIEPEVIRLDTVGAVVLDKQGRIASGVSSGGVSLKIPGRVGQAAMFGAGCYAESNVGISTSGIGEQLIRSLLAKECADHLNQCIVDLEHKKEVLWESCELQKVIKNKFVDNPCFQKQNQSKPSAGLIAIVRDANQKSAQIVWGQTTPSFCFAYSFGQKSPKFTFSKLPNNSTILTSSLIN